MSRSIILSDMYVNKLKRKLRSSAASFGQRLRGGSGKSYKSLSKLSQSVGSGDQADTVGLETGRLETVAEHVEQTRQDTAGVDQGSRRKRLRKFSSLESVVNRGAATLRTRFTSSFSSLPRAPWETEPILDGEDGAALLPVDDRPFTKILRSHKRSGTHGEKL